MTGMPRMVGECMSEVSYLSMYHVYGKREEFFRQEQIVRQP